MTNLSVQDKTERAILSALVFNNDKIDSVLKIVKPSDFQNLQTKIVFSAIAELNDSGSSIDLITLCNHLADNNKLVAVGGMSGLNDMLDDDLSLKNDVVKYARIVRKAAETKRVFELLTSSAKLIKDNPVHVDRVVKATKTQLSIDTGENEGDGLINLAESYSDKKEKLAISTGIEALDKMTNGLEAGDVTILSGSAGEGKSILLSMIMLSAIDCGYSVCAYSGELTVDRFQDWIYCQAAGKDYTKRYFGVNGAELYRADYEAEKYIRQWSNGKLFVHDNKIVKKSEESDIMARFKVAAEKYNCKLFVIDNLMSANLGGNGDENAKQTQFMIDLCLFAKRYDVHVILAAHKRKETGDMGSSNHAISGTANLGNLASNVWFIKRLYGLEERARYSNADAVLTVTKGRLTGEVASIGFLYSKNTRRFTSIVGKTRTEYKWKELIHADCS